MIYVLYARYMRGGTSEDLYLFPVSYTSSNVLIFTRIKTKIYNQTIKLHRTCIATTTKGRDTSNAKLSLGCLQVQIHYNRKTKG